MFDDIVLMKRINANAYRFSIEWSRVEPQDGTWNDEACRATRRTRRR